MRAQVWGCRGSLATPGADTVRYGGNTSCVEVQLESGETLVLDAGTGMRSLGVEMMRDLPAEIHVLLTHLHLDHLQGLGFFRPLFQAGTTVHLWGPASPVQSLAERIALYLSPPLFPVRLPAAAPPVACRRGTSCWTVRGDGPAAAGKRPAIGSPPAGRQGGQEGGG